MKRTRVGVPDEALGGLVVIAGMLTALAQDGLGSGHGAESRNMRLVGMSEPAGPRRVPAGASVISSPRMPA